MKTILPSFDVATNDITVEIIVDSVRTHLYRFPFGTDLTNLPHIDADTVSAALSVASNWENLLPPIILSSLTDKSAGVNTRPHTPWADTATTRLAKNEDWALYSHRFPAGMIYYPPSRHGVNIDVPTDITELAEFKAKHGFSPFNDLSESSVFVHKHIQLWMSGSAQAYKMDSSKGPVVTFDNDLCTVWPISFNNTGLPVEYLDDTLLMCYIPLGEHEWYYEKLIMVADESATVVNRDAMKHSLLLSSGTLMINGTRYDTPGIIEISPADVLTAVTPVIAITVWYL